MSAIRLKEFRLPSFVRKGGESKEGALQRLTGDWIRHRDGGDVPDADAVAAPVRGAGSDDSAHVPEPHPPDASGPAQ
jgi:hypothetical protein